MRPYIRKLLTTAKIASACCSTSKTDTNTIVNSSGKVSPKTPHPHTFEKICSYTQNNFTKNKKNFVEVIFITLPINVRNFRIADELNYLLRKVTTKYVDTTMCLKA